jgi:hypothetical protein
MRASKDIYIIMIRIQLMMFYVIFNNISVISWQFVLLLEETGIPPKK